MYDESQVKEFIRRLPEIDPGTVHLEMLACRSRFSKQVLGVKIKDLVLERKITRAIPNWRERYFSTVHNLSLLQGDGLYVFREGVRIPNHALVIYSTISPRSIKSAIKDVMTLNVDNLVNLKLEELGKVGTQWFSALHRHRDKSFISTTIDIDVLDSGLLSLIMDEVSSITMFMVTETSRGYHVILNLTRSEDAEAFYHGTHGIIHGIRLKYGKNVEIQRDSQEPTPGTMYYREGKPNHLITIIR